MPTVPALQAAIVDLDGTLIDTMGDFVAILGATFAQMQLPPVRREQVELWVGKGTEHLLRCALEAVGAGADRYQQAWDLYHQLYPQFNGQHSALFAGAAEGLARLRSQGLKLACVTNKPLAFARELLAVKGVLDRFDAVFGGDSFPRKKPDPMPLVEGAKALGTTPATTLMIGDSANDAQAARAAGCRVVLVTYGYNHGEPVRAVDADGFVDRIDQIDLSALA